MLSTKVKAGGISHLTDARYFAAWETEWLGFPLDEQATHRIEPAQLMAIREWVDGVKICGELALTEPSEILATVEFLKLEAVQLGTELDTEQLAVIAERLPVLQSIPVEAYSDAEDISSLMAANATAVSYFILQLSQGGITWADVQAGYPITVEQLTKWSQQYPILIDIDLGAESPSNFMQKIPIAGFSVQGGEEEKVGFKNFDELDVFFEDIEVQL